MSKAAIFTPRSRLTKTEAHALIKAGYTPVIRWVKKNKPKGQRRYMTTKEAKAEAALN